MERTNSYKKTEVGVIPEDWEVKRLGEVVTITSGESPSRFLLKDDGIPYYKVEQLNNCIKYQLESPYYIECKKPIKKGSIIFPKRGVAILLNKVRILVKDSYIDTNLMALTTLGNMHNEYLYYLLIDMELWRIADTTSIPQINNKHINPFLIPLPPLQEQKAIAKVLSDVDELITSIEELIDKKQKIKQATMQLLLTGKKRLPGFTGEWEIKKLGEVLEFQVGYPFESKHFNQESLGLRLVKNRDLKSDDQVFFYDGSYSNDYVVNNGDVLIGMDGDFLPCLWNEGTALLNQRVGRIITFEKMDLLFAYYFLIKPLKEIENATSSTTVKHLSHSDVENIKEKLPPLPEQKAIAQILSDMDLEIEALEEKLEKYKLIKDGMMEQLLTGKVRLI